MIIKSIIDNDLYKFSMQRAVLGYKQGVPVRYVFNNRRPEGKFTKQFGVWLLDQIGQMSRLTATDEEVAFLAERCPFLGREYLEYLRNYRYDPREVACEVTDGELRLEIVGSWERTILWEVPLMAMISELYFEQCDRDWDSELDDQRRRIVAKSDRLVGLKVSDFGTRRRRNYATQDLVVGTMSKHLPTFVGTSNVHFAHKHNVRPMGTKAHEWIMGVSALEGLKHANRAAMRIWADVYHGDLGTALPDTFGTASFLEDFDGYFARLYDGVRHDSGDPLKFADTFVTHYRNLGIDPETKTIIFSDGLDTEMAKTIASYCKGQIGCAFGIGTNLTNDYRQTDGTTSKPLNMVIKMSHCGGVPVVKLSDVPTKAIGDRDALRVAKWTFFGTPLDSEA